MVVGKLWYQFGNGKGRYVLCTYLYYNMCYYIKNAFFVQKLKKCYISDTLSNFFRIKNVLNHLESFSTCKKLHFETIGMANFSKWKYCSDSIFSYTMQECDYALNKIEKFYTVQLSIHLNFRRNY